MSKIEDLLEQYDLEFGRIAVNGVMRDYVEGFIDFDDAYDFAEAVGGECREIVKRDGGCYKDKGKAFRAFNPSETFGDDFFGVHWDWCDDILKELDSEEFFTSAPKERIDNIKWAIKTAVTPNTFILYENPHIGERIEFFNEKPCHVHWDVYDYKIVAVLPEGWEDSEEEIED